LDELHQEFPATTVVIAWHKNDDFEIPEAIIRRELFGVWGIPTVWFDGITKVVGGGPPMYPYYLPVYEERIGIPSNFNIEMAITNTDGTDYNVEATVEVLHGVNAENLALFVVLTETDLESPGYENQLFVARNVYPDGMGLPVDFSTQTIQTFNTVITLEDEYVFENSEVVVFIQNMDTKEIYQGTSLMMTNIITGTDELKELSQIEVYPNPATDRVNIKASGEILKVEVYNHIGQLVYKTEASSNILNFNIDQLELGIYLFRVQTAEGMFVESVIIE